MAGDPGIVDCAPWPHHIDHARPVNTTSPYSPSTASTPSSSSDSVFSVDAPSSQSSEASSDTWSNLADQPWSNEPENAFIHTDNLTQQINEQVNRISYNSCSTYQTLTSIQAVAQESRQHPRRTQRLNTPGSRDGKLGARPRPPPTLVRQSDRKDNFVDSLVDTTTQMIETIWPLSVLSCGRDTGSGGKQQNLIGLRTFVQEVLRRSKTSYSTLQVALYYLILIQSCLPNHDFTMEQAEDSSACRAMQCGRRMFLAALILASKYLQDRNYSARAWSKISGLGTHEINSNELAFLSAVNWNLHIPEPVFHRWTDIVLKYSPSAQVNTLPRSCPVASMIWKQVVPLLTPKLDTIPFGSSELPAISGYTSSAPGLSNMSPPAIPIREESSPMSDSDEATPTMPCSLRNVLEPTPQDMKNDERTIPPLPRLGPLPTPQMTPQTGAFCTPAVSASGRCSGRSMGHAMAQIQSSNLARSTLDNPSKRTADGTLAFPSCVRRSSLATSASSVSSPDSVVSDVSSRLSRSSSISSTASSNCALPPPRLAVQATQRCANMQSCGVKDENQKPLLNDDEALRVWLSQARPLSGSCLKRSLHNEASSGNECARTSSGDETRGAATALRDLHLNQQSHTPASMVFSRKPQGFQQNTPPEDAASSRTQNSRKRPRPTSVDLSVQSRVRELVAPRCLGDITNRVSGGSNAQSSVIPDTKVAESFLMPKRRNSRPSSSHSNTKPALSGECLPRKRTCAGSDRGGKAEARSIMRDLMQTEGPGMWTGII